MPRTSRERIQQRNIILNLRHFLNQVVFYPHLCLHVIYHGQEDDWCRSTQRKCTFVLTPHVLDGLLEHVTLTKRYGTQLKIVPVNKSAPFRVHAQLTLKVELMPTIHYGA